MAPYSVETQLFPKEPFEEAIAYFGEEGLGLELVEQTGCHVYFEGHGGYVSVAIDIGEEKTRVELETRGWDDHIKQFMRELAEFEERVTS